RKPEEEKKQLTTPHLKPISASSILSLDTKFAIFKAQLKKEKEVNEQLDDKFKKMKNKYRYVVSTNTSSALNKTLGAMRMEIEDLILYLTSNKTDSQDQNAALAENKKEIEHLQEQISLMKRKIRK
uniref:Uncharacterized protein n=1 Tax=Amphimedon queenslandica TaxID=400682 RepID=A0A1X7T9Y3_AMPQE